ncbi:ThiJ/PfpI family protein [Colletotrichum truncatum]|uniref:ThiJ/PfpI family protein n=1 Tax=Colletotrichum truncatum TaxID=5467 RepID=A0ACC3Z5I8_COLTU|nr:ThiJ/PfpI family protein [Colletotrichum truncatum]KAF6795199.1 ThiJ/PfpI family protein [Colletotrichum truncatum]
MTNNKVVKIGVFVPSETQLLDMACIDIFHMMSKEYLGLESMELLPKHLKELAPSVQISYITSKIDSASPITTSSPKLLPVTAGLRIATTHDVSHPDVQPGKLDILLVPGPDPYGTWDEDVLGFLKGHVERSETTDVLSVCTGIFLCGAAGVLEGRTVCGPRGVQDMLRKKYTTTKFVGEKYRYFQDGNLWTGGGITNGNDLVAAYARKNSKHFPAPIAEIACQMADVGDRGQFYGEGQTTYFIGFIWQVLKAWFTKPQKAKDI